MPEGPRLPPGQVLTRKWPVLHYSHVPKIDTSLWRFRIRGAVEQPRELAWTDLANLPHADVLCDSHCVTHWSRFDNRFSGIPVRALIELARPLPTATHVMVHADPDYTTNLPVADLDRAENLLATHHGGEPLAAEHGGPIRLVVPHLYFWKSAKWVTGFEFLEEDWPGFWEENGYHMHADPWMEERFGRPDPKRMRRGPRT